MTKKRKRTNKSWSNPKVRAARIHGMKRAWKRRKAAAIALIWFSAD